MEERFLDTEEVTGSIPVDCTKKIKKMESQKLTELAEKLLEIPSAIYRHQDSLLELNSDLSEKKNQISGIENSFKSIILEKVDGNGKKMYPNQESRETAFFEMGEQDSEYNSLKSDLVTIEKRIGLEKIRIEELSSEQRNIRSILEYFSQLNK